MTHSFDQTSSRAYSLSDVKSSTEYRPRLSTVELWPVTACWLFASHTPTPSMMEPSLALSQHGSTWCNLKQRNRSDTWLQSTCQRWTHISRLTPRSSASLPPYHEQILISRNACSLSSKRMVSVIHQPFMRSDWKTLLRRSMTFSWRSVNEGIERPVRLTWSKRPQRLRP